MIKLNLSMSKFNDSIAISMVALKQMQLKG
jgi:hypothetical protein